jgi:hypothetical protein
MKAEEFDKKFDEGEDITECLDVSLSRRPEQQQERSKHDNLKSQNHAESVPTEYEESTP